MELNINYPFFLYPGYPMNGYQEIDTYLNEVIRLYHFIKGYDCKKNSLLHINIGATLEELRKDFPNEWNQLFPAHVQTSECSVDLVIISPNKTFTDHYYKDPLFITATQDKYEWIKIKNRKYVSANGRIEVHIFCTMMPTNDFKRNQKFLKIAEIARMEDNIPNFKISRCTQTKNDLMFVESFYSHMNNMFSSIETDGGLITCFNYAVFRTDSENSKFNRYAMFRELIRLFGWGSTTRILGEWQLKLPASQVMSKLMPFNTKLNLDYNFSIIVVENQNGLVIIESRF